MRDFNRNKSFKRESGRFRDSGRSDRRGSGFGDSERFDRRGRSDRRDSGFRDSGKFERRDSGRLQLFEATCDKCNEQCEVPFRPSGEKPVYCSKCFRKDDNRKEESFGSTNSYKKDFEQLHAKLDKILSALELD